MVAALPAWAEWTTKIRGKDICKIIFKKASSNDEAFALLLFEMVIHMQFCGLSANIKTCV
jgi:hypothetical protein